MNNLHLCRLHLPITPNSRSLSLMVAYPTYVTWEKKNFVDHHSSQKIFKKLSCFLFNYIESGVFFMQTATVACVEETSIGTHMFQLSVRETTKYSKCTSYFQYNKHMLLNKCKPLKQTWHMAFKTYASLQRFGFRHLLQFEVAFKSFQSEPGT